MTTGGIVMVKLKAMADDLSVKPVFLACKKKNRITSKSGIPWKPGRMILLLFLIKKLTGGDTSIFLFNLVRKCSDIISRFVCSILPGKAAHISNGLRN